MKRIVGNIDISLSFDEIVEINTLIDRDIAKPMEEVKYTLEGEERSYYRCPICQDSLICIDSLHFCSKCGQRIDKENIAL